MIHPGGIIGGNIEVLGHLGGNIDYSPRVLQSSIVVANTPPLVLVAASTILNSIASSPPVWATLSLSPTTISGATISPVSKAVSFSADLINVGLRMSFASQLGESR